MAPPSANTRLLSEWHLDEIIDATGDDPTNVTALYIITCENENAMIISFFDPPSI